MSSNLLRIIPDLPDWVPDEPVARALGSAAQELFAGRSSGVFCEVRGETGFVDQGAWFESVSCPNCGSEIDQSWWQGRMDEAAGSGFTALSVRTECCGFATSLNDLVYRLPAGFARYVIEVRELDRTYADDDAMARLQRIAGRPLRQIAARY